VTDPRIEILESENARLEAELNVARKQAETWESYAKQLETVNKGAIQTSMRLRERIDTSALSG